MPKTIELLGMVESKALKKAGEDYFYINDTKVFFQEFKNIILNKFIDEQSVEDIFNLTQPDYSAIFLMFKKYSYLASTIDNLEQFVMRFKHSLSLIKEVFGEVSNSTSKNYTNKV